MKKPEHKNTGPPTNPQDRSLPGTGGYKVDETVSFEYHGGSENAPSETPLDTAENTVKAGMLLQDQYLMVQQAGLGKMGEVWEAFDKISERKVAVKVVSPRIKNYEEVMLLVKENFQSVHTLNHQYICPLYALAEDARIGYYLVMKWMPETLDDFIANEEEPLSPKTILTVLMNVAEALDYAHENNVIHRDVKPRNIAISRNESGNFVSASLIDFGLALGFKKLSEEASSGGESETGSVRVTTSETGGSRSSSGRRGFFLSGTPAYMPPEQWRGEDQDGRTDQYSLAVVTYELLSGGRPFSSHDQSVLRAAVLGDRAESIPNMPGYVNAALLKALSKKKEDRFPTCVDFVRALGDSQWQHRRRNNVIRAMIWGLLIAGLCAFFVVLPGRNKNHQTWEQRFNNVFERSAYSEMLDEINKKARGPELRAGLCIDGQWVDGTQSQDPKMTRQGPGWSYEWTPEAKTGTLTLSGYNSGRISARGFDLMIVVAEGTQNSISAAGSDDALSVAEGNLTIVGAGAGTGSLAVRAVSPPLDDGKRSQAARYVNAICVETVGKNLRIENLSELNVSSEGCDVTTLVSGGEFLSQKVKKLTASCDRGHDAFAVFGKTQLTGEESDVYTFNGGVNFNKGLWINADRNKGDSPQKPGVQLFVVGKKIDHLVDTYPELVAAFSDVSDDTVLLITDNFTTGTYSHPVEGRISRVIVDEKGKFTMISAGAFSINRGGNCNRMEEMFEIHGELTINYPDAPRGRLLRIIGGAAWKKGKLIPKTAMLGQPVSFSLGRTSEDALEIYKYDDKLKSQCVLINVLGTLTTYEGFTAQNNDNVSFEEFPQTVAGDQKTYAGGIHVATGATFNMYGGEIYENAAAYGAGVNVNGTFNMYGGVIRNNVAWNSDGDYTTEGAGVRIRRGTFNMYGGKIVNNVAAGKSAVRDDQANQSPEQAQLLGFCAAKGAGVHMSSQSTVSISGGEISGNVSQWAGGGIYAGGNGTSKLTVSGGAKIYGNLAVVGGGIFMNSAVWLHDALVSDNMVVENRGGTLVGVTTPKGDGIFIREMAQGNPNTAPALYLGAHTRISEDNKVFIQSNIVLPPKDGNANGVTFVPFHLTEPIDSDEVAMTFEVGLLGYIQEQDGQKKMALMENKIPDIPIPLVSFDFSDAVSPEVIAAQEKNFHISLLESAPGHSFLLKEHSEKEPGGNKMKHYLVLGEKK